MSSLPPEFFRRQDERPDDQFYAVPRPASHLDERADRVVAGWYDELLPVAGRVLDLFAGASSHIPKRTGIIGVGLDADALARNERLTERHRLDLNLQPALPFADGSLAGAVCTVSVQYLTQPVAVFAEVARCLRPGAPFLVAFSNRMFPTKAVLCWRASDDAAHARLVRCYFAAAGGFGPVEARSFVPDADGDPLYLLWATADPAVRPA
ncbi:MAG: class I SAM-dependent methyltransferase [Trueperaceae bacterium]|nr:class I SAM-dependent methyltransferase [Trueperaceae bacterium]